jgi:hypothetical protein
VVARCEPFSLSRTKTVIYRSLTTTEAKTHSVDGNLEIFFQPLKASIEADYSGSTLKSF